MVSMIADSPARGDDRGGEDGIEQRGLPRLPRIVGWVERSEDPTKFKAVRESVGLRFA
jgi:hypothetical protein